jgi:DNA polymerase-3 subunit gamma/tau
MAYQVFARKYRPQTFTEIIGQEPVVRTLTNALRLGRIAQAYLFVGPRGTGKTSTARILAKALEAANGPTAEFDPKEDICQEIAEGRCLDVLEIDGASNNGVEQVRDLRDNVRYAPAKGRYKIYIIDEVHMLSTAAFNALLKTLEEPPAHVKFIFATTEVHKLPTTILSRCQRFDLHRIPEPLIRAHLEHICGLENVAAEPGALDAIARYAEGGMRDAESALDQAISFYGDRVSEADVLSLFGLTGFAPVAALGRALAQGDVGAVLKSARELAAAGKDLGKLSQDLLGFFRNLVIYQVSPAALEGDISTPEKNVLAEVAPLITRGAALGILEELSHLESRLRYALATDVVFEVALIQMSQLREKISLENILESLGGAPSAPAAGRAAPHAPGPTVAILPAKGTAPDLAVKIPAAALAPAAVTTATAEAAWKFAVENFATKNPLEADTVRAVTFDAVKADQIEVLVPTALEKKIHYLRSPRNLEILERALDEKLGVKMTIVYKIADPANPPAAPAAAPPAPAAPGKPAPPPPSLSQEAFVNDPVIQNALKIFEAKIVGPA